MKDDTTAPTSPTKKRLRSSTSHSNNSGGELGGTAATAPATNDENSKGNDIVIAPSTTRKKKTRKNDTNDADDVVVEKEGSNNGSSKTSAAATATNTQQCLKVHRTIQDMICYNCVLCKMPRCESCFVCNATSHLLEEERGYCIRKLCCFIPIEFKYQPMSIMGFPRGWRFAFDDPQNLVSHVPRGRVFPHGTMAGLKITVVEKNEDSAAATNIATTAREGGKPGVERVHRSLQSAFAHLPHPTVPSSSSSSDDAKNGSGATATTTTEDGLLSYSTDLIERFLEHVGSYSGNITSRPNHFLVGRRYCAEFESNIVLFGKIVACMGSSTPQSSSSSSSSPSSKTTLNGSDDNSGAFFVVEFDTESLNALSKVNSGVNCMVVRPIQMITPDLAWGGCILYERKACIRRDKYSAIRNIDRATAVETWVAPDMKFEELIEQSGGGGGIRRLLPRLTVYSRGYKFVFNVRSSVTSAPDVDVDGKSHYGYGVYVSCTLLQRSTGPDEEINLKPGELIDLGIFSPLRTEDRKSLSSFAVKNYIHNLRPGRCSLIAGDDDSSVYDLTDDISGELHSIAAERVLSYVRPARRRGIQQRHNKHHQPTMHVRLDPAGKVHLLFGVRYSGSWSKYEDGMQQLVPIFCGGEVEVMSDLRGLGKKGVVKERYMQSFGTFQTEDIVACIVQLRSMFHPGGIEQTSSSSLIERCDKVVKCLEGRARTLRKIFADIRPHYDGIAVLDSALVDLNNLSVFINRPHT